MYNQLESLRGDFSKRKDLVWFKGIHPGEFLFQTHTHNITLHCFPAKSKQWWSSINGSTLIPALYDFSSVQLLSHSRLFATSWTAARQTSLSMTNSWSLLKVMSIESVMPSNHLILCCPLLLPPSIFPSIRVFSNESALLIRWQSIGVSTSASVLAMNIQD